jgi:nucleoside-diphosphate-sugar epimerase
MLTMQALSKGKITVFGGAQTRPNIHIDDITDLYLFLLDRPEITGVYNAGFENLSIRKIAEMACEKASAKINVLPSNDPRSYRQNSDRIIKEGFRPEKKIEDAIEEIKVKFTENKILNKESCYRINTLKMIKTK